MNYPRSVTSRAASDPATNIDFSIWPSPTRPWDEVRRLAEWADARTWRGLWYADHFMPNAEDDSVQDGDVLEAWTVLAAVAATTRRLRIGSLVSPTTVRHPAVLANTAATLDNVSNGRLVLGIGAGWQVNEHRAYGIDLFDGPDRVRRFDEAIRIVKGMLTHERTTFEGRHFRVVDAPCRPRPVQQPLPVMVGTGGPRMTAITAEHADEWNTWGDPTTAGQRVKVLDAACERIGRDPSSIRRSVQAMFFVVDDPRRADEIRRSAPADRSIIGSIDTVIEAIDDYRRIGFDEIIVPDFTLGADAERRLATYERFDTEVLTNFR